MIRRMKKNQPTPILFLDFDGTISKRDVTDAVLEQYADKRWEVAETAWRIGRIGSRLCLSEQMNLVHASRSQLNALLDKMEVDDGLSRLLEFCTVRGIPVHVISDGFDYCIHRILRRAINGQHRAIKSVCASHLDLNGPPWKTEFPFFRQPCAHGCATCKPAVMRLLNPTNAPAIFAGDGLSDRYAVECADLVFAKADLANYCDAHSIPHVAINTLADVAAEIDAWIAERTFRQQQTRDEFPMSVS